MRTSQACRAAIAIGSIAGVAAAVHFHRARGPCCAVPAVETATTPGATPGQSEVTLTGAASYEIPLAIPPGTAGAEPRLSLAYTSQTNDDLLGAGWRIAGLPRIERCSATIVGDGFRGGVSYGPGDRFCLTNAGLSDPRLVAMTQGQPYFTPGATYRTEQESWTRVVASSTTCGGGPCSFT